MDLPARYERVETVRAARIHRYGGPEVLRIDEIPRPAVRPRDILVEAHASSVNPIDVKIRGGGNRAIIRHRLPVVLGMDVSGVVVEIGAQVSRFAVGDEVYASPSHRRQGTYAEYVAVDERQAARRPMNISHAEAAGIPLVGLTAWETLINRGRLKSGDKVFVQAGSGGVGSIAIQIAKHFGAEVAATCSTRNVELVRNLGADSVVDYSRERYEEVLDQQNIVVDALGGDERYRAMKILGRGGFIGLLLSRIPFFARTYGPTLGAVVGGLDIARFIIHARLRGVRASIIMRPPDGAILEKITELIESGTVRPLVDRSFPLEAIVDAHRYSETGRARGKIAISIR